jgi:hypothetical protein
MLDPRAFNRGRPNNLSKRKRAGGVVEAEREQSIAQARNHDEAMQAAFAVLRTLGIQN